MGHSSLTESMKIWIITGLFLAVLIGSYAHARDIEVCFYDAFEPFIVKTEGAVPTEGLSADLVRYLNSIQTKYQFKGTLYPRKRMDQKLIAGAECVVPWVIPSWFVAEIRDKVTWLDPYFPDSLEVLSNIDNPIDYYSPEVLIGKTVGWVAGWQWNGIDPLKESGQLEADTVASPRQNFMKLIRKRIDATLVHGASFVYFSKTILGSRSIYRSPIPHSQFGRQMFVNSQDQELIEDMQQYVQKMPGDPAWQSIVIKW
jgi:polar amino acid transport system substrate-binding protein